MSFRPPPPTLLVGRDEALERMLHALEMVPLLVLHGAAGVGKTALSAKAAEILEVRCHFRVIWVTCREGWTMGSCLLSAGRQLEEAGVVGAERSLSCPDVATSQRARELIGLLNEEPTVLFIDDLHLLQSSFLPDLIDYGAATLKKSRLVLVSRERLTETEGPGEKVGALLLEGLEELSPSSLPFGEGIAPQLAQSFSEALGGRPLALLLLTMLVESGGADAVNLRTQLRNLIAERKDFEPEPWLLSQLASTLAPRELKLVELLSLYRIEVTAAALTEEGKEKSDENHLKALVSKGLITCDFGKYDMHPLLRELFRLRVSGHIEQLHDHCHRYLRNRAPEVEGWVERAFLLKEAFHHAYEADDSDSALEALAGAAKAMERLGLAHELLSMIDKSVAGGFSLNLDMYLQRTRLLRRIGRLDSADEELDRLKGLNPPSRTRAEIFWQKGQLLQDKNLYDRAMRTYYKALEAARQAQDKGATSKILNRIATVAKDRGEYERAKSFYLQGLKEAEEIEDRSEALFAIHNLGRIHFFKGEFDKARELFDKVIEQANEVGQRDSIALARNGLGEICRAAGELKEAEKYFLQNVEYYRATGNRFGLSFTQRNLGVVDVARGLLDRARSRFEASLHLTRLLVNPFGEAASLVHLADLHRMMGDFAKAQEQYIEAKELMVKMGNKYGQADVLYHLASLALLRTRYEETMDLLGQSLEIRETLGDNRGRAFSLSLKAELHRERGESYLADKVYERALRLMRKVGCPEGEAAILAGRATLLRDRGKYEEALPLFQEASEMLMEHGTVVARANVLTELGHLLRCRGDYGSAIATYEEALDHHGTSGDCLGQADILEGIALIKCDQGHLGEAEELFGRSLDIRRRLEGTLAHARGLTNLAVLQGQRGRVDEARKLYEESLELLVALENKREIQKTLGCLATIHRNHGDYEAAHQLIQEAYRFARDLNDRRGMAIALHQSAQLVELRGDEDKAAILFESSLAMKREIGDERGVVATLLPLADLRLKRKEFELAKELYGEALEEAECCGYHQSAIRAELGIAEVNLRMGRKKEASSAGEAIRERLEAMGTTVHSARLSRLWGLLAAGEGRGEDARYLLEYARDLYSELCQNHDVMQIEEELEALSKETLLQRLDRRTRVIETIEELDASSRHQDNPSRFGCIIAIAIPEGKGGVGLEGGLDGEPADVLWQGARGGLHLFEFSHSAAACRALLALNVPANGKVVAHAGLVDYRNGVPCGPVMTLPYRLMGLVSPGEFLASEPFIRGAIVLPQTLLEPLSPINIREQLEPLKIFQTDFAGLFSALNKEQKTTVV